jgi:SAM-dependent methyltransferase
MCRDGSFGANIIIEGVFLIENLSSKRYEPLAIDLENKNHSQSLIIDLTGRNKRVLEVGTSTGYISKILKARGNRVVGIEIDKESGEIAKQYCESMIIGDVEELDFEKYLEPSSFDVIMLGDILEHLRRPEGLLDNIKKYLATDGYLVVSLPNVCHGDILLNLMNRSFSYTSKGLLDETHLRFFGRKDIFNIFNSCGYIIRDLRTTIAPLGTTELKMDSKTIPLLLQEFIKALPDSDVYQFVFEAVPSENPVNEPTRNVDFDKLLGTSVKEYLKERVRKFMGANPQSCKGRLVDAAEGAEIVCQPWRGNIFMPLRLSY